ncbi:MAG: hypothetical protein COA99_14600 [Moraxellaceae bacterium]|nr:MAG: hypothetical protein COA99_14600 [Moraxellaceae bacterium]
MLKTSSKFTGAVALTTALTGCSWYTQLAEPTDNRTQRIGIYQAEPKDAYMMRFEELQLRIEALERENHRLRSPKSRRSSARHYSSHAKEIRRDTAGLAITPHKDNVGASSVAVHQASRQKSNDVIEKVKEKVSQAVAAIDRILGQLNLMGQQRDDEESTYAAQEIPNMAPHEDPTEQVLAQYSMEDESMQPSLSQPGKAEIIKTSNQPKSTEVENTVTGLLQRDSSGDVVRSTTYLEGTAPTFNYSVVYTYPESTPWSDMWQILDDANEVDKWRGNNPVKSTYFIYVGAYFSEIDAVNRQENLLAVTGEQPDLRAREIDSAINRAIAAN